MRFEGILYLFAFLYACRGFSNAGFFVEKGRNPAFSKIYIPLVTKGHSFSADPSSVLALGFLQGESKTKSAQSAVSVSSLKKDLCRLLNLGSLSDFANSGSKPGKSTSTGRDAETADLVLDLIERGRLIQKGKPIGESKELPGSWRLLFTCTDAGSESASPLDLASWYRYFLKKGPSPLQSIFAPNRILTDAETGRLFQVLDLFEGRLFNNLVEIRPPAPVRSLLGIADGYLCLQAAYEGCEGNVLKFRFKRGFFEFLRQGGGASSSSSSSGSEKERTLRFAYPVPFELLGEKACGTLETLFVDSDLRISRGNRGTVFVFGRMKSDQARRKNSTSDLKPDLSFLERLNDLKKG
uniref:Plastid lipid-associated protein/fibrillin conserved domain-containing protein n=1 Tax=Chromera velia CCMP2878 TaxID=1169474 RepID=A0A0G4H607_9ALVE|mmetsp:Transcript_18886/g.38143  ORF Transcript_18886/g.38143 Transcript_18886/m.38143 type:complete len:353 (-) Transcript_18886:143-1201(-)|eukprot:Cvel_5751.t1-p1 / transcript=Cvel_5751.t1 / gene=Cvel_5751 / organism=Chromera_velia_CCMP2878 / gene_product=hypothetical protein / transcript_product=hypothetical protein / location=Cvel_scaffold273:34954-38541(-) / protein_length=352 / sequence_SO=supercontig / SO=protein_coding / is_pseudo=false